MALRRNALVELFWRIHPRVYRWSRGRIGGELVGLELWHALVQRAPEYDEYATRTSRRIPVVVLERARPGPD